jgi:flagellar basal-body rod protein FlgF
MVFESFPDILTMRINDTRSNLNPLGDVGTMQPGNDVGEIYTYYNQGQLYGTNAKTDLALSDSGSAFFSVLVPDANGELKEYYTRDGSFVIGTGRVLMTKDGYAVEGQKGPITLSDGDFSVGRDGTILQNGQVIDKLMIKEFTDTKTLRKFGSNLVETTGESVVKGFTGTVEQGFIEQSNVNIVKEMVDMITVMRAYEANQKALQAQDSTLDKAVNEVGRL